MARNGRNPNIAEIGKKTQFGTERGYNAVKAAEKSNAVQAKTRRITQDLIEQSTPEMIGKANNRLLQMVMHGTLKAYEIWVSMLGEKPGGETQAENYADDGFLEALERTAAEDWNEEAEKEII